MEQFSRTENLIGKENIQKLLNKKVLIFGIGGVGSYVAEALARAGVGHLTIVDGDKVSITNINRQLIALHSNIGLPKVKVAKERLVDISPSIDVNAKEIFYSNENCDEINFENYDYIIDAIDMVSSKILIIEKAKEKNIPIISSMGTGNKLHPEKFEITDISKTSVCPLAKVMRKELKNRNIKKVKVLYSKEEPITSNNLDDKRTPASISFVPSCAGLMIAGEAIRDMLNIK